MMASTVLHADDYDVSLRLALYIVAGFQIISDFLSWWQGASGRATMPAKKYCGSNRMAGMY
jgi:hypothetical protein